MTQNEPELESVSDEQPFISHLIELRKRLLRVVLFVLVVFLCAAPYANEIYTFLSGPLLQHMPENSTMIATDVASPFFTPFKLALVASIFFSVPVILYHFWAFVAPGLYSHEKKMILPLLMASTLLFYMGVAFAYFVVFPLVFGFLTAAAPEGVAVMTDIAKYLDFVLTLFFAFGLSFEVPIITIVLVWTGLTTPQSLAEKRPYVIVGAFIVGMFLTPPDAISQTLLAVPIWILFETGLLCSRLFVRPVED
jgi:sec-independent protein translocase protein TatC